MNTQANTGLIKARELLMQSIIDTKKEMNDKINGFRKDVTYIKFNNLNEIFSH